MTQKIQEENQEAENEKTEQDKNQTWEDNHVMINKAIAKLSRLRERLPSKTEIAKETGLSRQTVYKHLQNYAGGSVVAEQLDHFSFLSSKVLAKLAELAMDGDVRAARLALEIMGILKPANRNQKQGDGQKRNRYGWSVDEFQKF